MKFSEVRIRAAKWTERNPIPVKPSERNQDLHPAKRASRDAMYNTHENETRLRGCVYCNSADQKPHECTKVTETSERRKIFRQKRLCFNCAGDDHKPTECKSRRTCLYCKRRHHTSICDKGTADNSITATKIGDCPVVYPVVFVEVAGIRCRALLDSGVGSSYGSAFLFNPLCFRTFV